MLFGVLSFFGLILLILSVAFLFIKGSLKEPGQKDSRGYPISSSPSFLLSLRNNPRLLYGAFALSFLLIISNWMFFYSSPGYQYFLVYPTGAKSAVLSEGYKFAPFATIQEWNKNIDIKTVAIDPEHKTDFNSEEGIDELEGVMNPIDIRFIDQVTGTMNVTTRFEIPKDPNQFIEFAVKYRNITNLVHNTLIPTISEQAKNTGFMYAAQDYISGAGQGFKQTFEEQLEYGAYVVVKKELRDTVWNDEIVTQGTRHIKEIQTSYIVQKVNDPATNKPKVIPNEIAVSGITVSQVIVDNVIPDPEYQARLKEQKGESAKRQLEQQKIATAKIAQQRVIAEGEQQKAAERVAQEIEQVKTLIPFETEREKEKQKLAAAEIAQKTAEIEARILLTKERAQADANRLKVSAGLTPQERAEWDYKKAVGVAEQMKSLKLPETVIMGESKGEDGLISKLLGAEIAKSMLNKKE
jgi:SPFH domain / Band 7 family